MNQTKPLILICFSLILIFYASLTSLGKTSDPAQRQALLGQDPQRVADASVGSAGPDTRMEYGNLAFDSPVTSQTSEGEASPVAIPEPSEKAVHYYKGGVALWVIDLIWGLLVPAVFLLTGFSASLRNLARKFGRNWFFTIGGYFILFSLVNFLIDLPLSYYESFWREHAYGLSNQTFGKWFGDELKSLGVACVAGFLFLWIPYWLLKKSPQRWWFYTGLVMVPFLFFVMLISPIWIDPLFNDYGPMKDKTLEAQILAQANRAGIEGSRVFEVNKSVDTKTMNAYVAGFLGTKRIVIWDTIIAKLTPNELLFAIGHEMGHYVLGHVYKGVLFFSALILATLFVANRLSIGLINRYKTRFGFDELSDIASLPLILLLAGLMWLVASPIANAYSRCQEHEADRFGLEVTQNNRAAAMAFVKLMTEDLGVPRPHPIVVIWRSTHPTLGDRIDFCNSYKPWKYGQPLKYDRYFKPVQPPNDSLTLGGPQSVSSKLR
ncbi:MAG TPA: M48 family metallopeptidase [Terriglobia bacterium]|nr:M48 family metallopeptidase [Terriglobia bacterium]